MKRKPDFSLPAIGRYVEALGAPYGLFRTLGDVSPEYDACGAPVFIAGNYAAYSGYGRPTASAGR